MLLGFNLQKIIFSYLEKKNEIINNEIILMNENKEDIVESIEYLKEDLLEYYNNGDEIPYWILSDYILLKNTLEEEIISYGLIDTNNIFIDFDNLEI